MPPSRPCRRQAGRQSASLWRPASGRPGAVPAGPFSAVLMPRSAVDQATPEADAQGGVGMATPGRVLVAEDNEAAREWTALILRREGYEVAQAANGEQALDLLKG